MATEIKIVIGDKNLEALQRMAHGADLRVEDVVLLAILTISGVFPMTTFAQIHRTMTACKHAPAEIREQCGMVLSAGAAGALVGKDFEVALDELAELIDPTDCAWTPDA